MEPTPIQIDAATTNAARTPAPHAPIQCRWVPGTLNQVRLTWTGHEVVVAAAGLLDLTGRSIMDALYLRGHAEIPGDGGLLDRLERITAARRYNGPSRRARSGPEGPPGAASLVTGPPESPAYT